MVTHHDIVGTVADKELAVVVDSMEVEWILENSAPIAPGVMMPKRFVARASIHTEDQWAINDPVAPIKLTYEGELLVKVNIEVKTVFGPVATAVQVSGGHPDVGVSSTAIRKVPVARIVSDAARQVVWVRDPGGGALFGNHFTIPTALRDQWPSGDVGPLLRHVATIYLVAEALGEGPTATVASAAGVSRATAGRYVEAARKAELLPPHLAFATEAGEPSDSEASTGVSHLEPPEGLEYWWERPYFPPITSADIEGNWPRGAPDGEYPEATEPRSPRNEHGVRKQERLHPRTTVREPGSRNRRAKASKGDGEHPEAP